MKRNLGLWCFAGFVLVTLGGTLLHFVYDWSGGNTAVAVFSGVNESTWEHMKLLYWPMVAWAAVQSRFFREYPNYWCVKLAGLVTGLVSIPLLFYGYNGAVGKSPDWLNITFFFTAAGLAFWREGRLFARGGRRCRGKWLAVASIAAVGVLFAVFTFATPRLPLFRDPLTGTYGVEQQNVLVAARDLCYTQITIARCLYEM